MNKWFASARDISDSEDSESSDEDQQKKQTQQQAQPQAKKTGIAPQKKNYMKNFEESSESEEEQRVVKTQKDKKLEIFNAIKKEINNHVKINDFSSLMTDFERFCEDIERDQASHASVIFESSKDGVLPISVLRIFVKIEDAINDTQNSVKDKKVTLNKTNSVSLNKLKQKMKKYMQVTGPADNNYEVQIGKFRENPVWSEDERQAVKAAQQKKVADQKEETKKAVAAEKKKKAKDESEEEESEEEKNEEEESEEEESYDEEEESEEEEEIDIFKIPREQMTPAQRRLKWVKKDRLPQYLQAQLAAKSKGKETIAAKQQEKEKEKEREKETAETLKPVVEKETKETILHLKQDYTIVDFTKPDNVARKLKEVQEERMRGKFDARFHTQMLTYILLQVKENRLKIEITLNLLNSLFDSAKMSVQGFMARDIWLQAYQYLHSLMELLETPQFRDQMKAAQVKEQKHAQAANEEDGNVDESTNELSTTIDIEKAILPALANFLEKLDFELMKAFQSTPQGKIEYLQRLRDDNNFLFLCDHVQSYMQEFNDSTKAARVAILKLDHLYYKNDNLYKKIKESPQSQSGDNKPYVIEGDSQRVLNEIANLINNHGTFKMKMRTTLYLVYYHSIHNRFTQAKDLLLKSHISDIIYLQDIGSQIIYNRAITQIGMAAFRCGLIEESHDILVDICQAQKLREILAQGISRSIDKPIELEKEEQKRQVPFHMHINLHLLDCIYMISAMLLEIPNIAENQYSVNKKIISKNFKKLIDQYDSKSFYLAAENYRDNLVFAAKQLNKSNWREAIQHIFSIKLIQKMPEFVNNQTNFKDTLVFRFKESALKAFLCRAARNYESFSVETLARQFEIEDKQLSQIVSKMVVKNKIQAHFDKDQRLIVLDTQSNEVKELQQLSIQYVDKLEMMVENNERLIDMIAGGQLYQHRERTATEISVINANKRQKLLMKQAGTGLPNIGQNTQYVILQNPIQRQQR